MKEESSDQGYQAKPVKMQLSLAGTGTDNIAGKRLQIWKYKYLITCRYVDTLKKATAEFQILLKFLINVKRLFSNTKCTFSFLR